MPTYWHSNPIRHTARSDKIVQATQTQQGQGHHVTYEAAILGTTGRAVLAAACTLVAARRALSILWSRPARALTFASSTHPNTGTPQDSAKGYQEHIKTRGSP